MGISAPTGTAARSLENWLLRQVVRLSNLQPGNYTVRVTVGSASANAFGEVYANFTVLPREALLLPSSFWGGGMRVIRGGKLCVKCFTSSTYLLVDIGSKFPIYNQARTLNIQPFMN